MDLTIIILLLSFALAMDAFAVSISMGMAGNFVSQSQRYKVALTFGFFQGLMFIIGYLLVDIFSETMTKFNALVACILLVFLGIRMIKEALDQDDDENKEANLTFKTLIIFGIATSIDAMAAGLSFGLMYSSDNAGLYAMISIAIITFALSLFGVFSGAKLEKMIGNKADIIGGCILIFLGVTSLF